MRDKRTCIELCADCGEMFRAGLYARLCPDCRKKRLSKGAKERGLSEIGIRARQNRKEAENNG